MIYYNKIISYDACKAMAEVGYSGVATVADAIDWFIDKQIYIDIDLETMKEPSWSWAISFMGDKWQRVYDENGGPVVSVLDHGVDDFMVCANSAIIAACDLLKRFN